MFGIQSIPFSRIGSVSFGAGCNGAVVALLFLLNWFRRILV